MRDGPVRADLGRGGGVDLRAVPRGLAAAVTAAWSAQVADRTAFYSTSEDNLASQGVARRLGLRPLGQW
jgi:hypothetical protein